MSNRKFYHETSIAFEGDPLDIAIRVVESCASGNYVLYEHSQEWTLGMGAHTWLTVYPDKTVVHTKDGRERVFWDKDLSITLHQALATVEVEAWRAYGTADFELARHNFGMELEDPDKPLAKMFVPETEVRIGEELIFLRALDLDDFNTLQKNVNAALANPEYPEAPSTMDVPAVDTHYAEEYQQSVATAVAEIKRHEYRKVVLSRRVPLPRRVNMTASFVTGRRGNTPARSYLLRLDGLEVGGFSPETVIEVSEDREVRTTPLAGTRSTGQDVREELDLREELVSNSKEIAEHAISVYVAYDELTMVCHPESVKVSQFMIVARRGSVQHLASRLAGNLLRHANPWYAFNALFPAVTASGVSKLEAIEAIGRLEPQARGLYSGCVMICDSTGLLDAALVLRSIYQQDDQAWLQAGAGVMDQSRPEREMEETREKLRSCSAFLVPADA